MFWQDLIQEAQKILVALQNNQSTSRGARKEETKPAQDGGQEDRERPGERGGTYFEVPLQEGRRLYHLEQGLEPVNDGGGDDHYVQKSLTLAFLMERWKLFYLLIGCYYYIKNQNHENTTSGPRGKAKGGAYLFSVEGAGEECDFSEGFFSFSLFLFSSRFFFLLCSSFLSYKDHQQPPEKPQPPPGSVHAARPGSNQSEHVGWWWEGCTSSFLLFSCCILYSSSSLLLSSILF